MSQTDLNRPLLFTGQPYSPSSPAKIKRAQQQIRRDVYNPIKIPPDIGFAERHGLATRTCKARTEPITPQTQICPCCGFPVHNELIDLGCKVKELAHIGVAYCVYFEYIKMVFVLVTANIILSGLAQLVLNFMGDMCFKLHNSSIICKGSVINILNIKDTTFLKVQNVLNCFFVVVSFFIIEAFRLKEQLFEIKYSKKVWLVEDYTALVNHLPHGTTLAEVKARVGKILDRSDLKQEEKALVKVYFIFNVQGYVRLVEEESETMLDIGEAKHDYQESKKEMMKQLKGDKKLIVKDIEAKRQEIEALQQKIGLITDKIKDFQKNFYKQYEKVCNGTLNVKQQTLVFSGRCIVTFNSRKAKNYLIKNDPLNSKLCYNPTDIIYKNFGLPKIHIPKSKHIFYLVLALVGDFFILTLLKKFIKVEQATAISQIRLFILSAVSSIICCGFNTLFGIMIRHFAKKNPNYQTKSEYFASVGQQLNITFMINMLATTYFSNTISFWIISYGESTYPHFPLNFLGLVYDMFFLFITNSYMSSVMSYFDIVWAWRLWKRYRIKKFLNVTQSQANNYFEGHPIDIALRYVNVNKVILISAAMAPIVPIGLEFTLLALIILYWIDKYLLIRRFTCKHKLSPAFTASIFKQLELYPLFLAFFNLLIMFIPVQESTNSQTKIQEFIYPNNQNTIGFYVAIVIFALSIWYNSSDKDIILGIYRKIFSSSLPEEIELDESNDEELYLDNKNKFLEDYSDYYPYFEIDKDERGGEKEKISVSNTFLNNMHKAIDENRYRIPE